MNPIAVRLAAFTVVLAGTFGSAYAVGEKLPGHNHDAGAVATEDAAHGHESSVPDAPVPAAGAPSDSGYRLVAEVSTDPGALAYHLVDGNGARVTEFTESHGAQLHTVLVRPDLSDFRHIHPSIGSDGSWSVRITAPGPWHLVFDAVPAGSGAGVVLTADFDDGTPFTNQALPVAVNPVATPELTVTLDRTATALSFSVTPSDGLEPYLGQPAHLIALRQGDLAFQHLHPSGSITGTFMFEGSLMGAGTYRLFLQFGHDGSVLTVPFTVVQP